MRPVAITLLVLCACVAPPILAGELAGVTYPDTIRVDSSTLVLNGLGLREATLLKVDVYVAALYLESRSADADAIVRSDRPRRLAMKFVRAVGRKDLVKAWNEGFEKSGPDAPAALKDRIATFNSFMIDMPNGGTMSFTALPGKGVTVEVQGDVKGTVPGADFAQALFGIWLGPAPPNPGLKEGLLGKR
ncbi:MAG TPA: chalcone isomerase family protein [Candidatus Polarisedimenticolia bacterium]|nr:chalcone isomerase family protein [Candidatus Polarisedimenticolia bacterium]